MKHLMSLNAIVQHEAALQNYIHYRNLAKLANNMRAVNRYDPAPGQNPSSATTKRLTVCAQNLASACGFEWDSDAGVSL